MATYTKATNFAVKDGLPSGNPSKIVKGTEIDTEFNAIQTAVNANDTATTSALSGKQPLDATLTSLALLGTAADKLAYTTGLDTWAETPITVAARTVLDDESVSTMRVTLGVTTSNTGSIILPSGPTAQRDVSPLFGYTRGNTDYTQLEWWNGSAWGPLGGTMVLATAQATTSGTSIDFTGIPSWAKRITIMFHGLSTSGTNLTEIRIGAGSIDSTGYNSQLGITQNVATGLIGTSTSGFCFGGGSSSTTFSGIMTLVHSGSNVWIESFAGTNGATTTTSHGGGVKTLSGVLDRIRLTTTSGTDTFDAGSVNIMYEG